MRNLIFTLNNKIMIIRNTLDMNRECHRCLINFANRASAILPVIFLHVVISSLYSRVLDTYALAIDTICP